MSIIGSLLGGAVTAWLGLWVGMRIERRAAGECTPMSPCVHCHHVLSALHDIEDAVRRGRKPS